jgi:hypothetical protein
MNRVLRITTIAAIVAPLLFSCQEEAQKEVRSVDELMQESEGSFPNTMEKTRELQQEVKKLNIEIKQESQQRIQEINKELEKSKKK